VRANVVDEDNSPIRVAAKAVIIDDDQILLTRNLHPNDPDGEFFLLPGGGQNHGETLEECLRREVLEETGYSTLVGDVLWVRDYIGANHDFAAYEPDVHQVEVMFSCSVDRSRPPAPPTEVDAWQLSVDWVTLGDLPDFRFFPAALVRGLVGVTEVGRSGASYLGDVN
jgi:8-oxo-dGTP diphosphatase